MKEIASWLAMSEEERLHCMKHVLPQRRLRAGLNAQKEEVAEMCEDLELDNSKRQ